MELLMTIAVTFFAGMGAGLGTGFAGMSAAAVISPMLISFLHIEPYMAVGIALSSDVLASAVSAYTYKKNQNLDIRNGFLMMCSVLLFTVVGKFFNIYDLPSRHQIYCETGDDHQGSDEADSPREKGGSIGCLWNPHRLHLRVCRSGWRHDDAPDTDLRSGI